MVLLFRRQLVKAVRVCAARPAIAYSTQVQQQQQGHAGKQALSWQELHRAAQIAAWSGLCYQLPDQLQARIQQQLTLVAHGRTEYTSWFIADGVVPHAHFCTSVRRRGPPLNIHMPGRNGSSSGGKNDSGSSAATGASGANLAQPPGAHDGSSGSNGVADVDEVCEVPAGARERFVFMRGVQFSAHDIDSMKLSQALLRMWPVPFPRQTSSSSSSSNSGGRSSALVAHDGVSELAAGLYDHLRPYLDQADDIQLPICFAGHSLGGSLAKLTMVLYQFHRRRQQAGPDPCCYTFGSPPVLAHEQGGGGHRVLQELGLLPDAVKDFVLENDPVPRALLSVDPTFELLKGWSAVSGLLQLRERLVGPHSPLSPRRFLFESVGQCHLIKWTQEGGSEVVPLDAQEIETELSMFVPKAPSQRQADSSNGSGNSSAGAEPVNVSSNSGSDVGTGGVTATLSQLLSPVRSLQAWLDHHHGSYSQELEAAALRGIKAAELEQQRRQQDQQQA